MVTASTREVQKGAKVVREDVLWLPSSSGTRTGAW
jgi:hypothetical protein